MHAINVRGVRANNPNVFYVGRACADWHASPLANPYPVGQQYSREQSIAQFKRDLWAAIQAGMNRDLMTTWQAAAWDALLVLVARTQDGQDVAVGCWCKPQACHADVICAAVEWLSKQQNVPPRCAAGREWTKKEIDPSPEGGFGARHEPISDVEF